MPTTKRLIADNSIYHVVQRGNNKQKIFQENEDFERFLSTTRRYIIKHKVEVYHYCLMINHVHFLVKIPKRENLAKLTQSVFQSYGLYYKKKYNYSGHLYQGRYLSKLINKDSYLLECGRYIERNPLRAGIVSHLSAYKWSSYLFYASGSKIDFITEDPLYGAFSHDPEKRRSLYKKYILTSRPYEDIVDKEFKVLNLK